MGASHQITKTVSLGAAGGGADTLRVWDAPESQPFTDIVVTISSRGAVLPAGDLDYDVLYGGVWAGTAFLAGSTISGGTSRASGTIAGGTTVESIVWNDATTLPANRRFTIPTNSGFEYRGLEGLAISCELVNKKVLPVTLYVTFASQILSESQ